MEILLGDNPFFGIDHLSQERARERARMFSEFERITDIVGYADSLGVSGFVVSTHPGLRRLVHHMGSRTDLLHSIEFYPIMPYVQGYVARMTTGGIPGTIRDVFSGVSVLDRFRMGLQGLVGYLKTDPVRMIKAFVDIELAPLRKARIRTVFLHDVVTDMCVGLGLGGVLDTYVRHVSSRGFVAGMVTKNLPLLLGALERQKLCVPHVMTSFNPIGFQMNPSRGVCEAKLGKYNGRITAMNTLAGGLVKPRDTASYLSGLGLSCATVGVSTKDHLKEYVDAFA